MLYFVKLSVWKITSD